jgi:uncharacterized protein (DUF2249 family)
MNSQQSEVLIDVREIPPRSKHAQIYQQWKNLPDGAALFLINDHDPLPLYYQFSAEFTGEFHWEYVERGPEIWKVRIAKGEFQDPGFTPGAAKQKSVSADRTIASSSELVLDVRPLINHGGSPCAPIEEAVASLKPGQTFVLLVPFEPIPLYAKLERQGYSHTTRHDQDGTWRIEFRKTSVAKEGAHSCSCGHNEDTSEGKSGNSVFLDVCGLEPPEPLVRALETLTRLKKGSNLVVRSDRKPMHLFTQLEERGFAYDCSEQSDHKFLTEIWHQNE